jgi:predicted permease
MSPWRNTWADFIHEWRRESGPARLIVVVHVLAAALRLFVWTLPSGDNPMRNLGRDLHFALRRLRQTPLFFTFAVVTLALGIGAATAVYSVVHAVALKAPNIDDVERVVKVYHSAGGSGPMISFSWLDSADLKARQTSFSHMATWSRLFHAITLPEGARPFGGELVDGDYFDVLRVRPMVGRLIQRSDDSPSATPVVVLSADFWRSAFGGDASVLNSQVEIGGHQFTVIGVAPPEARGVDMPSLAGPSLWVPIQQHHLLARAGFSLSGDDSDRSRRWLSVVARLRDGVSLEQAAAEVRQIGQALDAAVPIGAELDPRLRSPHAVSRPWVVRRVVDVRIHESMAFIVGPVVGTVLVSVGLVLLVACTNLANLLLARGASRRQEFAVRMALGASRWRLLREQIVECGVLALAGGVLGLLVARVLVVLLSTDFTVGDVVTIVISVRPELNAPVLMLAVFATALALLTFGVLPAWHSTGGDVRSVLSADGGGGAPPRWRGRRLLIQLQVAVSVALLAVTAVSTGNALRLALHDPGFALDQLALVTTDPTASSMDSERAVAAMAAARDRVSQLPGVDAAAFGSALPIGTGSSYVTVSEPPISSRFGLRAVFASAGYFATVGMPVLEGRDFTTSDEVAGEPVIVLSAKAAGDFFGRTQVIGQSVTFKRRAWAGEPPAPTMVARVVGVVGDASDGTGGRIDEGTAYLPVGQHPVRRLVLVARTPGDASAVAGQLRTAVNDADRQLTITGVSTGESVSDGLTILLRIVAGTAGILGAFAALLALLGLYGVLSFLVARRTREIGVRIALGAERSSVLRLIMTDGLKPVVWGILLGVLLAGPVLLSPLSRNMLGTSESGVAVALLAPVVMLAAATLAAWWPARRAAQVDPNVALRQL